MLANLEGSSSASTLSGDSAGSCRKFCLAITSMHARVCAQKILMLKLMQVYTDHIKTRKLCQMHSR
ncbi:hypothetical protein C2845_PM01G19490 [Panicum miliaceum]|uniref:Uncharacterized protein n=1 Tax=Panicum miliaceum TaxID=4540 RepID=A0A3L6TRH7_PANMI|nr:hypothetical protein C2845_PM01G19490 [Panicum miliaceum]